MYFKGLAVEKDDEEAFRWIKRSAEKQLPQGMFALATMYDEGIGVVKSQQDAFKYFKQAAEAGHLKSQTTVGYRYLTGTGVSQNLNEALKWTKKAAEAGEARAQYNLGWMSIRGVGMLKYEALGYAWIYIASLNRLPDAVADVHKVRAGGVIDTDSITEGKEIAQKLIKKHKFLVEAH